MFRELSTEDIDRAFGDLERLYLHTMHPRLRLLQDILKDLWHFLSFRWWTGRQRWRKRY